MAERERTVVVLGKGSLAIRICDWFAAADGYRLAAIIPVVPEPTWTGSLIEWADGHGVESVASGHYADLSLDPDLAFSVFYDRIISAEFIARCGRILNLHNGPLPRYRGVSPINWALKNGERSHGATIHEITPGIDDGPIVGQVTYSIYPQVDEVQDVYARALDYGYTLFAATMPLLDRIEATPQDDAAATYYSLGDNARLGDRRSFTRAQSLSS